MSVQIWQGVLYYLVFYIYLHMYMCLYKFGRGGGGYPIAMKLNSVYGVSAMGDAYVYESMYMEPSLCSSMRCLM